MSWFGIASYGVAAFAYAGVAAVLLDQWFAEPRTRWLIAALAMSAVWAGGIAFVASIGDHRAVLVVLEVARSLVWLAYVLSRLAPRRKTHWLFGAALAIGMAAVALSSSPAVYVLLLANSLAGLLAVALLYRGTQLESKPLLFFCSATAAIFLTDMFVYLQATLNEALAPSDEARGFINIALVAFIVFAVKRSADDGRTLALSRQAVFYTASVGGVGAYLVGMTGVAYLIGSTGSKWSFLAEVLFLAVSVAILAIALSSATVRTQAGVFLIKHFYRHKYDYRWEWLRLTQNLGRGGDLHALAARGLEGLAGIVGSGSGTLWLERGSGQYDRMVSLDGSGAEPPAYSSDHPLVKFLAAQGWVVDTDEYAGEPERYGNSFGHPSDGHLPESSLVVPLDCQGHLQGFVVLTKPAALRPLNFEDHDILKTAGRQVGVVLAQALALEKLYETRQFEAMNRLSIFLMHDLKNIVAQQQLILSNAQRFRHRPEFIDDSLATIRAGVERMKRVLDQLHAGSGAGPRGAVDVSKVLMEVRSQCADRAPVPRIDVSQPAAWAGVDREKFVSALTHLVRNAQDATPATGQISMSCEDAGSELTITVSDTGAGMDPEFVRDRLFRPFDSTKGLKGMGIGAYQVREIVRSAGGRVEVDSEVGVGTTFRLHLPALAAASGRAPGQ